MRTFAWGISIVAVAAILGGCAFDAAPEETSARSSAVDSADPQSASSNGDETATATGQLPAPTGTVRVQTWAPTPVGIPNGGTGADPLPIPWHPGDGTGVPRVIRH